VRSDVNIFIKRDKCYVCGICIERCIMDNLRMYLAPAARPAHSHELPGLRPPDRPGKRGRGGKEMRKDLPFSGIVGRFATIRARRSVSGEKKMVSRFISGL